MGMWNESSLFIFHVQHAQLTNQSTMLSGFIFSLSSLVYVSLLLYLYVAVSPSPVRHSTVISRYPTSRLPFPSASFHYSLPFSHPLNHIATVSSNPIKKLEAETEHPIRRASYVDTSNPSNYASHPVTQSNGSIISFSPQTFSCLHTRLSSLYFPFSLSTPAAVLILYIRVNVIVDNVTGQPQRF